jgi:hypothetical protein
MKFPDWFKKPDAKTAQPDPKAQLQAAQRAHTEAQRRVEAARAELETKRTPEALAALRDAKTDLEDLGELAAIAQSDLDRAEAEHQAARRAELERRRDVLQAQLADRTEAAELERLQVEAYIATVEAEVERIRHLERRVELQRSLFTTRTELGEQPGAFESDSTAPSTVPTAEALHARAAALPVEDPRRALLQQLAFRLAPALASGVLRGAA